MTRNRRTWIALGLLLGTTALLLVLATSIGNLELKPGAYIDTVDLGLRLGTGAPGDAVPLDWHWLWRILKWFVPIVAVLTVVGSLTLIKDPEFRSKVLPWIITLAAFVLIGFVVTLFIDPQPPEELPREAEEQEEALIERPASDRNPQGRVLEERTVDTEALRWPVLVTIFLAAALLLIVAVPMTVIWRNRRLRLRAEDSIDEIASIAAEAAREIAEGGDAVGVVQRCYVRMVRVLSQESSVRESFLTPREFAAVLHRKGFDSKDIDELTYMFELVRYGERADETFAERAHRCLSRLGIQQEAAA